MIKLKTKTKRNNSLGLTSMSLIAACSGDKGAQKDEPIEIFPIKSFEVRDNSSEFKLHWDNNITTTIAVPVPQSVPVPQPGDYDLSLDFSEAVEGRLDLISGIFNSNTYIHEVYIYWDIEQYKDIESPDAYYLKIHNSPLYIHSTISTDKNKDNFILVEYSEGSSQNGTQGMNQLRMSILWDTERYNTGETIVHNKEDISSEMLHINYIADLEPADIGTEDRIKKAKEIETKFGGNEDLIRSFYRANVLNFDFDGEGKNDIHIELLKTDDSQFVSLVIFGEKQATGTFDLISFLTLNSISLTDHDNFTIDDTFISADLDGSGGDLAANEQNFAAIVTTDSKEITYQDRIYDTLDYQAIADAISELG